MAANTLADYMEAQPLAVQRRLRAIRKEVKKVVPKAEEGISYGIPAFSVNGKRFFYMAAWKEHIAVYPVTAGSETFQRSVQKYRGTKSALHFRHDAPLPVALMQRIVRVCLKRYTVKQRTGTSTK